MAAVELTPLSTHLETSEIQALEKALVEAGASPLDIDPDADTELLERDVDDDLLAELFDRLDVNNAACNIYVPPDFEDSLTVGDYQIGSAHALILALQELAEEMGGDDGGDEEFEEDDEEYDEEYEEEDPVAEDDAYALRDSQLRRICKILQRGAQMCIRRGTAMFIHD